jgi:putative sterol carrier protein
MAQSVREFFDGIAARLDPDELRGTTATYRFDIEGAGSWVVDLDDGVATVTEGDADADCVVTTSEAMFLQLLRGEGNATTMYMSGKLKVQGDLGLALKLQKLLS